MYVLFDIGGTKTRIALTSDLKTFRALETIPTAKAFEEGIERIVQTIRTANGAERISAIAGGIAGPVDSEKTMAVGGPNIPSWHRKPLVPLLSKQLSTSVYLQNDAVMGTLGEAVFGIGKDYKTVVYITVSTGVGGAKAVDGKVVPSARGYEPGWQIIDASNTLCKNCSSRGYLIEYISGADVLRVEGKPPYEITDEAFWDEKAKFLAYGLNNITALWSPDIIVLGGSMMKVPGIPIERVRSYLKECVNIFPDIPRVEKSVLGDDIGLYGAMAYLAEQERV